MRSKTSGFTYLVGFLPFACRSTFQKPNQTKPQHFNPKDDILTDFKSKSWVEPLCAGKDYFFP